MNQPSLLVLSVLNGPCFHAQNRAGDAGVHVHAVVLAYLRHDKAAEGQRLCIFYTVCSTVMQNTSLSRAQVKHDPVNPCLEIPFNGKFCEKVLCWAAEKSKAGTFVVADFHLKSYIGSSYLIHYDI